MQNMGKTIVVLGTGGTIAGTAARADDHVGYVAAQIGVDRLIAAIPALAAAPLEHEQVAQIDSKDMDFAVWHALAGRVGHHLARPDVAGVVATHGTDTLEETAYFLQRVLAPRKPVVLTGAMRPASSSQADGPGNLWDAVRVARESGACGVTVAMAGEVHGAFDVRKVHASRVDAFASGDAGPVARIEGERVHMLRPWPVGTGLGLGCLPPSPEGWPWVEIIASDAGADGRVVRALCEAGVQGLVVAATGNGTVHRALHAALLEARRRGVPVLRSTRCVLGGVLSRDDDTLPGAGVLTPAQARVALLLQLLERADPV